MSEPFSFGDDSSPAGIFLPMRDEDETDLGVERLFISSRRSAKAILEFEKNNEYSPERDSALLRVFLQTTLDGDTWNKFVSDLVLNSPISHQTIRQMLASPSLFAMLTGIEPASARPTRKRASSKNKPVRKVGRPRKEIPIVEEDED